MELNRTSISLLYLIFFPSPEAAAQGKASKSSIRTSPTSENLETFPRILPLRNPYYLVDSLLFLSPMYSLDGLMH